jgi:DNA modification methylase
MYHSTEHFTLYHGDNREVLKQLPDNSIDSVVTDPPYELGFMGKKWDSTGIAYDVELWREVLRVLKPGGHLLAFSGSRTYHRMAIAIEDAGFDIRDQIMWIYGSGFPKSLDIGKALDKVAGAERTRVAYKGGIAPGHANYGGGQSVIFDGTKVDDIAITAEAKQWQGWGTALKPAHEPIVMARKFVTATIAANVLEWGVGGLNIDGTRVGNDGGTFKATKPEGKSNGIYGEGINGAVEIGELNAGRWPANVIHDGSDEVVELFGEPLRFFYCAKASKRDRNEGLDGFEAKRASSYGYDIGLGNAGEGMFKDRNPIKQNHHPTVKPTDLMAYLCRLVTPKNGTVLDPFMGSGSTGKAAMYEGFKFIGIEMTDEYLPIAKARIEFALDNREETLFNA